MILADLVDESWVSILSSTAFCLKVLLPAGVFRFDLAGSVSADTETFG
jgi:hypothetical protein